MDGEENGSSVFGVPHAVVLRGSSSPSTPQKKSQPGGGGGRYGDSSGGGRSVHSQSAPIHSRRTRRDGVTFGGRDGEGGASSSGSDLCAVNVLIPTADVAPPLGFIVVSPDGAAHSLTHALYGACDGPSGSGGEAGGGAVSGWRPLRLLTTLLGIADSAPRASAAYRSVVDAGSGGGGGGGGGATGKGPGDPANIVRVALFAAPGDATALAHTLRALGVDRSNVARLILFSAPVSS